MRLALSLVVILAGCTSQPIEGHPPLNEIVERISLPWKHSDDVYTTVGTNVYTASIARFNQRFPEGSNEREALLRHEAVHARRQFDYKGLPGELALLAWVARYTTDAGFMWLEEQHALYAEITYLQSMGRWGPGDTLSQAESLDQIYRTASGKQMITMPEAEEWINKVLRGEWKP